MLGTSGLGEEVQIHGVPIPVAAGPSDLRVMHGVRRVMTFVTHGPVHAVEDVVAPDLVGAHCDLRDVRRGDPRVRGLDDYPFGDGDDVPTLDGKFMLVVIPLE